jgi:hypothetical protein
MNYSIMASINGIDDTRALVKLAGDLMFESDLSQA